MKRADIEVGKEYAVRISGVAEKCRVTGLTASTAWIRTGIVGTWVRYQQVLMPWPQYEAQQKTKADRDAAVQEERERHAGQVNDASRALWRSLSKALTDRRIRTKGFDCDAQTHPLADFDLVTRF